ncbi:MAG: Iodothyronine deiodinase [Syntrophorhabdaceae bacterium PtaU1.Bin034]|nr:MAG: Iodothyronine deiodinase [Syntrophorhabdaceae bacterium PtaU1.Bin034]
MAVAYRYDHFRREVLKEELGFRAGPAPGDPFPAFDLETTDGGRVRKSEFVGKRPVLITLGSVTSPMTASAGPVLKRLYKEFGEDVEFITLYIREAHPGERYPQPKNFREKLVNGRIYKERDRIPWQVAVDDIEGTLHRSLDSKTNAAYIIDLDGNVAFRSLLSNDYDTLYRALAEVLTMKRGSVGQSEKEIIPIMRGLGELYDTLDFAGNGAKKDFFHEMPAMYGLARAASFFRPLPPLARVLFTMAGIGAVAGIAAGVLRRRCY